MAISRNCKTCNKEFNTSPSDIARGRGIWCSRECRPSWNKGLTKLTDKRLNYIRPTIWKKNDVRITGNKQRSWKGGITEPNHKARTSIEYHIMQRAVFERDNYTCTKCNERGIYLHVDHIESFAQYLEGRFNLDNCRTLCRKCHYFITFKKVMPKDSKWGFVIRKEIHD